MHQGGERSISVDVRQYRDNDLQSEHRVSAPRTALHDHRPWVLMSCNLSYALMIFNGWSYIYGGWGINPCLFVFSLVVTRKLYIGTLPNVKSRITTAYHKEQPNGQANTSPSFCCRPM